MGKKSKPPPPPDYAALARQQAALDKQAATEQTVTNRPNQVTPWGTTTWQKSPTGEWTETVALNPADQAALDRTRQFEGQQHDIASGLLDEAGVALGKPMSLEGLPELKDFDFSKLGEFGNVDLSQLSNFGNLDLSGVPELADSGFGAVEGVREAMMSRLAPSRARSRESEISRLKSQGLNEGHEAFQRAMQRLDEGDTDAEQQALLGASSAYGDIFNRSLAARQQGVGEKMSAAEYANALRNQQFGEQTQKAQFDNTKRGAQMSEQERAANLAGMLRQQSMAEQSLLRDKPINDYMKLVQGTTPEMPDMPSFMAGTGYDAANVYGAGKDQYQAQMDRYNANQARYGGITKGLFGLGGAALGGPIGGAIGKMMAPGG